MDTVNNIDWAGKNNTEWGYPTRLVKRKIIFYFYICTGNNLVILC